MKISETSYHVRVMGCIVIVQLLVLAIVILWPLPPQNDAEQEVIFSENETAIDEMVITRQESRPPPPPAPQVPVPVPNDEVIEEEIVFQEMDLSEFSDSLSVMQEGTRGDSDEIASNPQQPPSLVKIVEANTTDEARKAGLKARVWVNFLVDKEGRVEEATIDRVEIYDEDEEKFRTVDSVGYGLTGQILTAALQWKFRPAKNNGDPVRSYVKHAFSFGI